MTPLELEAIATATADAIKVAVDGAVSGLLKDVAQLRADVTALKADVEHKSAALDVRSRFEPLEQRLSSFQIAIKALEDREPIPGPAGPQGPIGPQGDKGEPGEMGPMGPVGPEGKPGDPGKDGRDGKDGESIQGPPGERGADGSVGPQGVTGEKGERGEPGIGEKGTDGKDGRDGRDGIDFNMKDLVSHEFDGERTLRLKFARDGVTYEAPLVFSGIPIDRGVFVEGTQYKAGEFVTWGGSLWMAKVDTSEKPGTTVNSPWQLRVKKGRDGRDGQSGPQGPAGPKGDRGEPGGWR